LAALKGQRVLIFGDSLSHRGSREAPVQVEVREGSSRTSSVPGDLLASYLLEAGASAARLDAKVSRSAYNFFRIENANTLLAADQAWKPTLAIIFLGTNDLGLNMDIDAQSMAKIRDAFRAVGADVWAIGPPMFAAEKYSSKAPEVVAMMKRVFGENRFIDARPLTTDLTVIGRSSDGVHFTSLGAKTLASRLAAVFRTALDTNVSPTVAVSTATPTMPASTARTEIHPFVKGFGYGLAALAFVGVGVIIKRRMSASGLGSSKIDRKKMAAEIRQWDRLRMTQGKPKARKPIWFVDPETGELLELDYDTAVFRGAGLRGTNGLEWKKKARGVYEASTPQGVYIIDGNNRGRNRWTVTYPNEDYGMADSLQEAQAWAEQDLKERSSKGLKGLGGIPSKKSELRKMFAQALKASEGDRRNQGTWQPVGDTGWEVRHFNVASRTGYSKHVELRKIGHNRTTSFGKSYTNSVADKIFTGDISSTWIDQDEGLKGVRPYADSSEFRERMEEVNLKLVKATADRINEVAKDIAREGDAWGGRKVFISDIAKRLGTKTERLAGPILIARNKGWLVLARADMPFAMDMNKVSASEVEDWMGNQTHFIEIV
jgi:lysophospholipase L1-like esterase